MCFLEVLGVHCLRYWRCLPEVCVLVFEGMGFLCLKSWCRLPEACVLLFEASLHDLLGVFVLFARSMCVVLFSRSMCVV